MELLPVISSGCSRSPGSTAWRTWPSGAGLAVHRNDSASRAYALAVSIAYAGLFLLGLIFGLNFLGGLMPLNGPDHVLHLLNALVALGAYFASRRDVTAGTT